jgi:hypothetical protein
MTITTLKRTPRGVCCRPDNADVTTASSPLRNLATLLETRLTRAAKSDTANEKSPLKT